MYYKIIENFYKLKKAKRSNAAYIKHIDEGLLILDALNADENTKDAFCVHPLLQIPSSLIATEVTNWDPNVVLLAMEYRNKANAYSTRSGRGAYPPKMILPEVTKMLVADKIQNYKEFLAHKDKYTNKTTLEQYFTNWLIHLDCNSYRQMLINKVPLTLILEELKKNEN